MIIGAVENLEASVEIEVFNSSRQPQRVLAVIDTGYNGHLTLPAEVVASLGLSLAGQRRARLADDRLVLMDVFRADIRWHGARRKILVSQTEGGALAGMRLLAGSRMTLDVIDGGQVTIEALPGPRA